MIRWYRGFKFLFYLLFAHDAVTYTVASASPIVRTHTRFYIAPLTISAIVFVSKTLFQGFVLSVVGKKRGWVLL